MNVFCTSLSPRESALALDDKRLNKMIIESAQQLSTSLRFYSVDDPELMKSTHVNSGSSKWARETRGNFQFLYNHYKELYLEFYHRFGKSHASGRLLDTFPKYFSVIPEGVFTFPLYCRNKQYEVDFTQYEGWLGYRLYLLYRWKYTDKNPKWTMRGKPSWYNEYSTAQILSGRGNYERNAKL